MEFVLTAIDDDLASAFEEHCGNIKNVSVFKGSIFDVDCDAVVSPANSFGFMDGGIDSWYRWRFGDKIQDSVRLAILRYWHGELPVGAAEIVETNDDEVPFLIAAPTMRVPMILGTESINPYLAMRAVIMLVREERFRDGTFHGEDIKSRVKKIALPGLGTGVGKVPGEMAAHQIKEAISLHGEGKHYLPKSWSFASEAHQYLLKQDFRDLQKQD